MGGEKFLTKICPNCGNELKDDAKFCNKCGSKLNSNNVKSVIKHCPNCGKEVSGDGDFCNYCGNSLNKTRIQAISNNPGLLDKVKSLNPKQKRILYLAIIIIVACFLVLHFINFYFVKLDIVEGKYSANIEQVDKAFQEKALKLQKGELNEKDQAALMAQYQAISQISPEKMDKGQKNMVNLTKEEVEIYCGKDFKHKEPDFYTMSQELFAKKSYSFIYILVFLVLGFHLYHAINSLAQTFGLSHKKYSPVIEWVSVIYAVVVPLGFAIIPIWIMFVK